MHEIITDYLDAKQLADRLTALELHSTSELARLEKERDDALSQIAQAECRAERFCQERDELIDKNKKLNEEVDDLIRQRPLLIEDFKRERDEAREDAQKSKAYKRVLKETNLRQTERIRYLEEATNHACGTPLSVALKERDEARNAIVGWENKWRCAVEMAARAELERDEALKCAKEYYVEFIRNASSDNKVSKPNPLNPFYKY